LLVLDRPDDIVVPLPELLFPFPVVVNGGLVVVCSVRLLLGLSSLVGESCWLKTILKRIEEMNVKDVFYFLIHFFLVL
jgi:hypothetical protein